jgi:hypothetical protein
VKRTTAAGNIDGLFTNGDPANQIPATAISADDFNVYQEELVNVVLCAGLTLDQTGADKTQVVQAIKVFTRESELRNFAPTGFHTIGAGTGAANIAPAYINPAAADNAYDYAFHPLAGVLLPGMVVEKLYITGAALAGVNNVVAVNLESVDLAGGGPTVEMSTTIQNGEYTNNSTTPAVTIVDTKAYSLVVACKADSDATKAKFYAAKIELA